MSVYGLLIIHGFGLVASLQGLFKYRNDHKPAWASSIIPFGLVAKLQKDDAYTIFLTSLRDWWTPCSAGT